MEVPEGGISIREVLMAVSFSILRHPAISTPQIQSYFAHVWAAALEQVIESPAISGGLPIFQS